MSHPQLAALDRQLDEIGARAERLGQLDETRFKSRPAPDAWSPAECVAHLTITTERFLPLLDAAIGACPTVHTAPAPKYGTGFMGWLLAAMLEPPARFKIRTTPGFVPSADGPQRGILDAFAASQRELRQRVHNAEGRDLARASLQSPFDARVRYNTYAAFVILAAHQRRHLWQAEQAVK